MKGCSSANFVSNLTRATGFARPFEDPHPGFDIRKPRQAIERNKSKVSKNLHESHRLNDLEHHLDQTKTSKSKVTKSFTSEFVKIGTKLMSFASKLQTMPWSSNVSDSKVRANRLRDSDNVAPRNNEKRTPNRKLQETHNARPKLREKKNSFEANELFERNERTSSPPLKPSPPKRPPPPRPKSLASKENRNAKSDNLNKIMKSRELDSHESSSSVPYHEKRNSKLQLPKRPPLPPLRSKRALELRVDQVSDSLVYEEEALSMLRRRDDWRLVCARRPSEERSKSSSSLSTPASSARSSVCDAQGKDRHRPLFNYRPTQNSQEDFSHPRAPKYKTKETKATNNLR